MYWTLELASKLDDAPWPATKEELMDYAVRSGAPAEVPENLAEIEDEGDIYETIEDIWPDSDQRKLLLSRRRILISSEKPHKQSFNYTNRSFASFETAVFLYLHK